jgi:hypothetical protein
MEIDSESRSSVADVNDVPLTGLLLVLAASEETTLDGMTSAPNGSEEQHPVNLASLGYCTALLSIATCEAVNAIGRQAIAHLLGWTESPIGSMPSYQPMLDKIDVDRNVGLRFLSAPSRVLADVSLTGASGTRGRNDSGSPQKYGSGTRTYHTSQVSGGDRRYIAGCHLADVSNMFTH